MVWFLSSMKLNNASQYISLASLNSIGNTQLSYFLIGCQGVTIKPPSISTNFCLLLHFVLITHYILAIYPFSVRILSFLTNSETFLIPPEAILTKQLPSKQTFPE